MSKPFSAHCNVPGSVEQRANARSAFETKSTNLTEESDLNSSRAVACVSNGIHSFSGRHEEFFLNFYEWEQNDLTLK
jgi:hypothetical protein